MSDMESVLDMLRSMAADMTSHTDMLNKINQRLDTHEAMIVEQGQAIAGFLKTSPKTTPREEVDPNDS